MSLRGPAARRLGRLRLALRFNGWALLVVPGLAFLSVFFLVPLAVIGLRSVTDVEGPSSGWLANYADFFGTDVYLRVLGNTFWIAALCTVICAGLGYPYAYLMTIVPQRFAGLLLIVVLVPFWSSPLVRTYAWQVLLRDTGVINGFLLKSGLISEPFPLIRTTFGVLLGMCQILLPLMVLPVYAVMRQVDPEYTKAAANLGAGPFTAFRRVFLPLSIPGLLAGSLLVFVVALGFYITPALLGSPQNTMISSLIANAIQQRADFGAGSALGVILLVVTLVVLIVASRLIRFRDVFGSLESEL